LEFEISHPFHPDRGRRLRLLNARTARGVVWLWYADDAGKPRQVKQSFTDRAEADAFERQAGGRCAFHLKDLVELVAVATRLARRG
jgi:hypothetical protein